MDKDTFPATAEPQRHKAFLPFVAHQPLRPVKAGVAFSSHTDFAERVALLGGKVRFWRGWAVWGQAPPVIAGLLPTPCLTRDFYYRANTAAPLDGQLILLDYLGAGYDGYLLFLNEPNEAAQADMQIRRAVQMYVHTRAVVPHAKLVGVGVSHNDYLNGFPWMRAFVDGVRRETGQVPQMAHWDIHTYLQAGAPLAPVDALEAMLAEYGIVAPTFFISEWGADTAERTVEMKRAFDGDSRIVRHYWYDQYMAEWDGDHRPIQLFEEGSAPLRLSAIGEAFLAA